MFNIYLIWKNYRLENETVMFWLKTDVITGKSGSIIDIYLYVKIGVKTGKRFE